MDLREARELAEELLEFHVGNTGWTVGPFTRRKTQAGVCVYNTRQIRLSAPLVKLNTRERVIETILHEIAHVLVGPDVAAHGPEWAATAKSLGLADPAAKAIIGVDIKAPPPLYQGVCERGCKYEYLRRPAKRTLTWGLCGKHGLGLVWTDLRKGTRLMVI